MNILVTGASRGIGKAICEMLGDNIFAAARSEKLLSAYKNYCVCDLATYEGIEKLGNYIVKNQIDVLINNAGEYIYSPIEEMSFEQIEHITKLNLSAPLYLISKAVPYMKEKRFGRIINIGSISGVMGEAYASAYSASKSGLIGATKALALELASYGITVNTINPGWVDTDMGNSSANEGEFTKEELVECIPQKRFVSPYEIACMVKYLISEPAKGVTGQAINLCAGLTCGC
ncbi:MAG: SDR family oxidoreductase [bacterium]|nr:SDR family oxidoreductase [bacterium]